MIENMKGKISSPYDVDVGSWSVLEGQGCYTYNLPLPPCSGDNEDEKKSIHPRLSLCYRHSGGNGECGKGWFLNGCSVIERVGATMAYDGFIGSVQYDARDRLALDGKRLIVRKGNYWDTDAVYFVDGGSADFVRVKPLFSSNLRLNGFIWENKYNIKRTYWAVEDEGNPNNTMFRWKLIKVEKCKDCVVEYEHTVFDRNIYPYERAYLTAVKYGDVKVNFEYEQRKDIMLEFVGGMTSATNFRLTNVSLSYTYADPSNVDEQKTIIKRLTTLNYVYSPHSAISRIQRIDLGSSGQAISFIWQDVPPNFDVSTETRVERAAKKGFLPFIFNPAGDPKSTVLLLDDSDIMKISIDTTREGKNNGLYALEKLPRTSAWNTKELFYFCGNFTGEGSSTLVYVFENSQQKIAFDVFFSSQGENNFISSMHIDTDTKWVGKDYGTFFALDVDGDGRLDLVNIFYEGNAMKMDIFLCSLTGTAGTISKVPVKKTIPMSPEMFQGQYLFGSLTGTSLTDMTIVAKIGNKTSVRTLISDYKMDGTIDFFSKGTTMDISTTTTSDNDTIYFTGDATGSGSTDLIVISKGGSSVKVFYGNKKDGYTSYAEYSSLKDATGVEEVIPFNAYSTSSGLGLLVICKTNQENIKKLLYYAPDSAGGYTLVSFWSLPWPPMNIQGGEDENTPLKYTVSDMTGKGVPSVVLIDDSANDHLDMRTLLNNSGISDVITEVYSPFHTVTKIEYSTLSSKEVYSHATLSYPYVDPVRDSTSSSSVQQMAKIPSEIGGFTVVREVREKWEPFAVIPTEDVKTVRYSYTGAQMATNGRGWQGFQSIKKFEVEKGTRTTTVYNQKYPYTGTVFKEIVETYTNWGEGPENFFPIIEKTKSHSFVDSSDPRLPRYVLCEPYEEVKYYGERGEYQYSYAVQRHFDNYGNAVEEVEVQLGFPLESYTVEMSLASKKALCRLSKYDNNVEMWQFGLPKLAKVTTASDTPMEAVFVSGDRSITTFNYDVYGQLIEEVRLTREENSSVRRVLEYDSKGNIVVERLGGMETLYTFDASGVYPVRVDKKCNDELITSLYGYDPLNGARVAELDPAGDICIRVLDDYGRIFIEQRASMDGVSNPPVLVEYVVGNKNAFAKEVMDVAHMIYQYDSSLHAHYIVKERMQSIIGNGLSKWTEELVFKDCMQKKVCEALKCDKLHGYSCVCYGYDRFDEENVKTMPVFAHVNKGELPRYDPSYANHVERDPLMRIIREKSTVSEMESVTEWKYSGLLSLTKTFGYGSDAAYSESTEYIMVDGKLHVKSITREGEDSMAVEYIYGEEGELREIKKPFLPNGPSTYMDYDACGRLISWSDPDRIKVGKFEFVYDGPIPDKKSKVKAGGVIEYTYDTAGRLRKKQADSTTEYNYNYYTGTERVSGVSSTVDGVKRYSKEFQYDTWGNVTRKDIYFYGVNGARQYNIFYRYDPCRRVVSSRLPDGTDVKYDYDNGVITKAAWSNGGSSDAVQVILPEEFYNPGRQPEQYELLINNKSKGTVSNSFQNMGLLNSSLFTDNDGAYTSKKYNYIATGRVGWSSFYSTEAPNEYIDVAYEYTNGMLTNTTCENNEEQDWQFSYHSGRMMGCNDKEYLYTGTETCPSKVVSKEGATKDITTDTRGRVKLIKDKDGDRGFTYDGFNMMTSVVNSAMRDVSVKILYDENGDRLLEQTTGSGYTASVHYVDPMYVDTTTTGAKTAKTQRYLFASLRGSQERDAVACVESQQRGAYKSFTYTLYQSDNKGNVFHFRNYSADGKILEKRFVRYDPYGKPNIMGEENASPGDNDPFFEQKTYGAVSACYYFNSRWYDPVLCIFLTPDNEVPNVLCPFAANPYCFERNDPINRIDPSGHASFWSILGIILGAISFVLTVLIAVATAGAGALAVVGAIVGAASSLIAFSGGVLSYALPGHEAANILGLVASIVGLVGMVSSVIAVWGNVVRFFERAASVIRFLPHQLRAAFRTRTAPNSTAMSSIDSASSSSSARSFSSHSSRTDSAVNVDPLSPPPSPNVSQVGSSSSSSATFSTVQDGPYPGLMALSTSRISLL